MVSPWTTERDALLTEMHGRPDEPSFRVMAEAINKECGTVLTRNACISRARRIHLPKRLPCNQSTFNKQTVGRKTRQPSKPRQRYSNESKRMMTIFESVEAIVQHVADVKPLNVSLIDLEPHQCRWPYGPFGERGEILFCGHGQHSYLNNGTEFTSSYCLGHFALSKRRMT